MKLPLAPKSADNARRPALPVPPRRAGRRRRVAAVVLGAVVALVAAGLLSLPRARLPRAERVPAQGEQSVVVTAAERYRAGWLRRMMLGDGHREVWATPVRVPVLDLATHAGGLTVLRRGGGNQTYGLHLRGADGREFRFRSVDKDQGGTLGPFATATLGRVRQDQVGALLPAAGLLASAIEIAAGVAHPQRQLVVLPNDPRLGPHRAEFAGMLGLLERHPDDGPDGSPGFRGSTRIVGTDDMLAALRTQPAVQADGRAYLTARLVDIYLGDWDRHEDQWRWAHVQRGDSAAWMPIARDRDYALVDYRGAIPAIARAFDPKVVRFDGEYRDLPGLLVTARALDRALLCRLPPAAWDSAAGALQAGITNDVIDRAVGQLPPEYARVEGGDIARKLRTRRDGIRPMARRYRQRLHASECA